MRINKKYALLSENGTISALFDTVTDSNAELARYMEYLLAEKKWTTAQNLSSLQSMTPMIARKSHRQKSAIGFVVVSHTDPEGVSRLQNFGRTFFSLDDQSNYDNFTRDPDPQIASRTQALVPWTFSSSYLVYQGTRFVAANGVEFLATANVASRTLKEDWSTIVQDPSKYAAFLSEGGWDGIKYLRIPVIQGKLQSYSLGQAVGSRFESFLLPVANCEDATNNVSSGFLKFLVNTTQDPTAAVQWYQVNNILLAGPTDNVFEVTNLPDYSGIVFKVGDGITGAKLPAGALITGEYLQTAGAAGNLDKKYQITTIIPPNGTSMIDPRTGSVSKFLSATNIGPILGGLAEESIDDLRANAPSDYLNSYASATTQAYESQIQSRAQVGLSKVKVFSGDNAQLSQSNGTISSSQSVLYVTAIASDGSALIDGQNLLVGPVSQALGNLKSPTDTLVYMAPNVISLALGVVVSTTSADTAESDIVAMEAQLLTDNFSIFASDFKKEFRDAEFVYLTKSFPFADGVETVLEALAEVSYSSATLSVDTLTNLPELINIPFQFDTVFGETLLSQGFKSWKENAPYMFRIEVSFLNNPTLASQYDRTFLVYDQRGQYQGSGNISAIDFGTGFASALSGQKVPTDNPNTAWELPQETTDNFQDRLVRIAQFPTIQDVTTPSFVLIKAKSFATSPFEIRPFVIDSLGKKRIFPLSEVATNLQDPLPGGAQCYQIDPRFINNLKVTFTENYDVTSQEYAAGILTMPLSYFQIPTGISLTDVGQIAGYLNSAVRIRVMALPLLDNISPSNWNDIVAVDSQNIKVNVTQISQ